MPLPSTDLGSPSSLLPQADKPTADRCAPAPPPADWRPQDQQPAPSSSLRKTSSQQPAASALLLPPQDQQPAPKIIVPASAHCFRPYLLILLIVNQSLFAHSKFQWQQIVRHCVVELVLLNLICFFLCYLVCELKYSTYV
uniref:Uncharacterized protein n=1 Tax=Zea mays TaxID=4577 RepID=A0A804PQH6_MAIZE